MAKTQDDTYANDRTKPFPLTELDFSGEDRSLPSSLPSTRSRAAVMAMPCFTLAGIPT